MITLVAGGTNPGKGIPHNAVRNPIKTRAGAVKSLLISPSARHGTPGNRWGGMQGDEWDGELGSEGHAGGFKIIPSQRETDESEIPATHSPPQAL